MKAIGNRADLYGELLNEKDQLLCRAEQMGPSIGITDDLKGRLGSSGAGSAFPGIVRDDVIDAATKVARDLVSPRALGDEMRRIVKSVYGDDYDVAATNSCEAALGAVYDSLFTPPQLGRGEPYRARCIGLLERHAEHQLSYGRPFPPLYKDVFADRGSIAGELGINGRRMLNTDIVMVRMAGASYTAHGSKMLPCPLLLETNGRKTLNQIERTARTHASDLTGFISLGYDTAGYGYGDKDENGAPLIQCGIGKLADEYDVPYVVDNAWGVPIVGADLRQTGADAMLYSMDKVSGSITSGLIIGTEFAMVNVRRALGVQSERFGAPSAHGKGAHVSADPGKVSMAALVHILRELRDKPERHKVPVDRTMDIVLEVFEDFKGMLGDDLVISKSYNLGGVEINYQRSWRGGMGIPMFSNEDRVAGAQLLGLMMMRMGVVLIQAEDGNVLLTPGFGTMNADGTVDEHNMRLVAKSIFGALSVLKEWVSEKMAT